MDVVVSEVSMIRDIREREIHYNTDSGRICRPLLIVNNEKQCLKMRKGHLDAITSSQSGQSIRSYEWHDLVASGVIEYRVVLKF